MVRASLLCVLAGCGRIAFAPVGDGKSSPGGDGGGGGDARGDAVPAGDADLSTGLRFSLPLDGLSGHVVAEASGQNGWAANLADVTTTTGVLGGGLHFDGSAYNSYVILPSPDGSCPAVPMLTGSVTIAAWMRFDSLHDWGGYTLGDVAVMQGSVGGQQGAWGLGATNGCGAETIGFEVAFDNTLRFIRCGKTTLTTATWHFVVGVYDAGARTVSVYLDGVDDTGAATANSSAIGSSLDPAPMCPYLGASANQGYLMIGSLDEVRIYDRPLAASDVAALYVLAGG